jgi:hypothetical protein
VPAVQDRIVQSAMTRQIAKNARAPYLTDDACAAPARRCPT